MPRRPAHSGPDSTASDGRSAESRSATRTGTNQPPEPPGEGAPDALELGEVELCFDH